MKLMRNLLLTTALGLGIAAIIFTTPMSANIPSRPHTSVPEPVPETKCEEYLATLSSDRIDQWITTIQIGLNKNPQLPIEAWSCVLDIYKMSETDQFMLRRCRDNMNTSFEDLAFEALEQHLKLCDLVVIKD